MKTVAEIINANYVLVPLLKDTNMGYMITDRGDMSDYADGAPDSTESDTKTPSGLCWTKR